MKNKWSKYALKDGKVKSSYIREYSNRKKIRKTGEASNSNEQSWEKQAQEEIKLIYKPPMNILPDINSRILQDAWVINLKETNENIREENPIETHQEGRQRVQSSDQGRCEVEEGNTKIKTRKKDEVMVKKIVVAKGKEESAKEVAKAHQSAGGSNVGKYKKVSPKEFAGTAGGAPKGSYPINTEKRAKAALAYAHNAPDPAGIKEKVLSKYPELKKKK
ncbi:MAG: hypothetical protein ACH349_01390 [Candidatus Rhabdochlamydia sp.]